MDFCGPCVALSGQSDEECEKTKGGEGPSHGVRLPEGLRCGSFNRIIITLAPYEYVNNPETYLMSSLFGGILSSFPARPRDVGESGLVLDVTSRQKVHGGRRKFFKG